jgi:hypothetical protein
MKSMKGDDIQPEALYMEKIPNKARTFAQKMQQGHIK